MSKPPPSAWGAGSNACRRTLYGARVLLLAAMPACAVYDPQLVGANAGNSGSDETSGSNATGGSIAAAGNSLGGSSTNAGATSAGGSSSGASSGGSNPAQGGTGSSGAPAAGSAGVATAGAGVAGASAGATNTGGSASAGAPAGGAAAGGSPSAGSGNNAGSGGAPGLNPCDRTNWKATASRSSLSMNPPQLYNPPVQAIDGAVSTRWSSGLAEDGSEWFLVDLGARASHLTQVVLDSNKDPTDFPVAYQLELSTDGTAFTQVATGAGTPITTITFADKPAQYIRVKQTGVGTSWWTIHELTITCQQ